MTSKYANWKGPKQYLGPDGKAILREYALANCAISTFDGKARWKDNLRDEDIVELLRSQIPNLTKFHIRRIRSDFQSAHERREHLQQIHHDNTMDARLDALEQLVKELTERVADLENDMEYTEDDNES